MARALPAVFLDSTAPAGLDDHTAQGLLHFVVGLYYLLLHLMLGPARLASSKAQS